MSANVIASSDVIDVSNIIGPLNMRAYASTTEAMILLEPRYARENIDCLNVDLMHRIAQTVEIVSQGCMDLDGSYDEGQVAVGRLQRGTMRFFVNSQKLGFSPEYVQQALAAVRDILATLVP